MTGQVTAASMRHGLLLPNAGYYATPARLVDFAVRAEESGWDGVFLWDHLMLSRELQLPVIDTWTVVATILARTRRLHAGPLVTPLARRRPWKVAREAATLDHLSGGRLILGVGLGADDLDFGAFGESANLRMRAEKVDEALQVLAGLWSGNEFSYAGRHYTVDRAAFLPTPTTAPHGAEPRVPIWAAAIWPASRPGALLRAAQLDGIVPMVREPGGRLRGPRPAELAAILARLESVRHSTAIPDSPPTVAHRRDVVAVDVAAPTDSAAAYGQAAALAATGATWRLESFDPWRRSPKQLDAWLDHGPALRGAEAVRSQRRLTTTQTND